MREGDTEKVGVRQLIQSSAALRSKAVSGKGVGMPTALYHAQLHKIYQFEGIFFTWTPQHQTTVRLKNVLCN